MSTPHDRPRIPSQPPPQASLPPQVAASAHLSPSQAQPQQQQRQQQSRQQSQQQHRPADGVVSPRYMPLAPIPTARVHSQQLASPVSISMQSASSGSNGSGPSFFSSSGAPYSSSSSSSS